MAAGRVRIASVRPDDSGPRAPLEPGPRSGEGEGAETAAAGGRRLAVALLDASPRVFLGRAGTCRLDARGWARRGGEPALVRRIRSAARAGGFPEVRVGIADSRVAADAAARRARGNAVVVPPGGDRAFLAPLPLGFLPLPDDLRETLTALGLRQVGELAARTRPEMEARFGPAGLRALRLAHGRDDEPLHPLSTDVPPEAALEVEGGVSELEPLLFVLRRLLGRVCEGLAQEGRHAARLELILGLEDGSTRSAAVSPARPTLREGLLFDLCRSALERTAEGGLLPAPIHLLALRVPARAPADARQMDLFARETGDPLAADGALSRLRARLGPEAVARPTPRADHRPETRNRWEAAGAAEEVEDARTGPGPADGSETGSRAEEPAAASPLSPVLRLLPHPRPVDVETAEGAPVIVREGGAGQEVAIAEGPERLSGDWWRDGYRREYYRILTEGGELLWIFREGSAGGHARWWLHGWWD